MADRSVATPSLNNLLSVISSQCPEDAKVRSSSRFRTRWRACDIAGLTAIRHRIREHGFGFGSKLRVAAQAPWLPLWRSNGQIGRIASQGSKFWTNISLQGSQEKIHPRSNSGQLLGNGADKFRIETAGFLKFLCEITLA
jgi:hypothetical protein